ncbi:MAG: dihydropteroate synthase [Lysobacteraceae bacterium]|nr:MAG: dihydropteroate synthase [Xanthomonadaceae bacterium]
MFDTAPTLDCAGRRLSLDRPRIMGVVNLTPDSFSDGGRHAEPAAAVEHALRLVEEGADLLDLGGESTRPGASPVDAATELGRVMPVLEALLARVEVPVAVDTSKPEVMRAAIAAGAHMINDVRALRAEGALEAVAGSTVAVCLMHMQGEPRSMQQAPTYQDVVEEVRGFLADRLLACELSGIERRRLVIDPGFGFGKTVEHNYRLLRQLSRFVDLGVPVLAGLSRKSMIGAVTGLPVDRRDPASAVAAVLAAEQGARLLRVHDVAGTRAALAVWQAWREQPAPTPSAATPRAPVWPDED